MNTKYFPLFWLLGAALEAEDLTVTKIGVVGTSTHEAVVGQALVEITEGQTLPRHALEEAASLAVDRLTTLKPALIFDAGAGFGPRAARGHPRQHGKPLVGPGCERTLLNWER